MHPISTGKNWGLGSDLPWRDDVYILDLSGLTEIVELNEELGFAVVQPGVTQTQLAERLKSVGSRFYFDVTGSGAETSVMGASLDRGIAYNSLRTDVTGPLKVLLADGRVIETGFPSSRSKILCKVYPQGTGPDLTGLFYQSNFGVVLEMTVRLIPKGDSLESFVVNFDHFQLPRFLKTFRYLREQNVFHGVTHIANRRRSQSSLLPRVVHHLKTSRGRTPDDAEPLKMMHRFFPHTWTAFGTLQGHRDIVRTQKKLLKRYFSDLGSVQFPHQLVLRAAARMARIFRSHSLGAFLGATQEFAGMTVGQPTNAALGSTRVLNGHFDVPPEMDEEHRVGFLFMLPILPYDQTSTERFIQILDPLMERAEITLNVLGTRVLEGVVSLNFDQTNTVALQEAHAELADFHEKCADAGFLPYRVNIDRNFSDYPVSIDLARDLKSYLDPDNIISPRRYDLSQ